MNEITKQVLTGSLMGDGSLTSLSPKFRRRNSFYGEQHTSKQKEYVLWKCNMLSEINTKVRYMERTRWGKTREEIHMWSLSSPELTIMRAEWYPDGIKHINKKILKDFSDISFAIIIQDDGAKNGVGMTICTESFSPKEVELFSNYIESKWDIKFTIGLYHGIRNRVYIGAREVDKLLPIVKKWIHPTMEYKFGNRFKYEKRI